MPTPPSISPAATDGERADIVAPLMAHVVVRPFLDSEQGLPFESQPIARPVIDVGADKPNAIRLLDPALKFKTKRDWPLASQIHLYPADGDASSQPIPAATAESVVASTASQMAANIFEGFNATAVVFGHSKSGKATVLFGDAKELAKEEDLLALSASASTSADMDVHAVPLPPSAGLLPRFCNELFLRFAKKPPNSSMAVTVEVLGFEDPHNITDMTKKAGTTGSGPKHVDPEPIKVREETNGPQISGSNKTTVNGPSAMLAAVKHGYSRYRKFKARPNAHFITVVHCVETLTFADPKSPSETITKTSMATAYFAMVVGRPTTFFRCIDSACARDRGENDKAKVPFRESSVTRLLQDFFGGNSFAYSFACIGPHHSQSKDAVVVLDLAAKIEHIRTRPRISYDETTTEFRKLDNEVNNLSSQLSAAREAHEVVQEELTRRYNLLREARSTYDEQTMALDDLAIQKDTEKVVNTVQQLRLQKQSERNNSEHDALKSEINDATNRNDTLAAEIDALDKEAGALTAAIASSAEESTVTANKQRVADAEIARQEERYAEVELSQQGLGAIRDRVEEVHTKRIGTKADDAAAMKKESAELDAKCKEMEMPLRVSQIAVDSLEGLRKRVAAAKDKQAKLKAEAESLPKEIQKLEEDVARLDKEANAGCCVVM